LLVLFNRPFLVIFVVSNILGLSELLGKENLWPILLGFILVPALAHIGLFFAVESPKHAYFNENDINEAQTSKYTTFF
jgi:hypothetical protein